MIYIRRDTRDIGKSIWVCIFVDLQNLLKLDISMKHAVIRELILYPAVLFFKIFRVFKRLYITKSTDVGCSIQLHFIYTKKNVWRNAKIHQNSLIGLFKQIFAFVKLCFKLYKMISQPILHVTKRGISQNLS